MSVRIWRHYPGNEPSRHIHWEKYVDFQLDMVRWQFVNGFREQHPWWDDLAEYDPTDSIIYIHPDASIHIEYEDFSSFEPIQIEHNNWRAFVGAIKKFLCEGDAYRYRLGI